MLKLTRYGRREILAVSLAAVAACGLLSLPAARGFWPALAAGAGVLALWGLVLAFFRDPQRQSPAGEGLFVSPADGRVTDITAVGPDSPLGRPGVQVGVFMSVFDVHVNRSPCDARVERVEHRPGCFLDARDPAASGRNESTTIHMTCRHGGGELPLVVRQVAGLIARRIVTDLKSGQELSRGQRIGMIKFSSRAELLVPEELAPQIRVSVGQRVKAGITVLLEAGKGTT